MYKQQPSIKLLLSFDALSAHWTFFKDGRFTLVWALFSDGTRNYNTFGQAFCSMKDEYDVVIGCRVALHRICDNLLMNRDQRKVLFTALDECVGGVLEEAMFND